MVTDQSAYERKKELTKSLDLTGDYWHIPASNQKTCAGVAELVDALDLGSSIERCEGSSPFTRTILILQRKNFRPGDENRRGAERYRVRV